MPKNNVIALEEPDIKHVNQYNPATFFIKQASTIALASTGLTLANAPLVTFNNFCNSGARIPNSWAATMQMCIKGCNLHALRLMYQVSLKKGVLFTSQNHTLSAVEENIVIDKMYAKSLAWIAPIAISAITGTADALLTFAEQKEMLKSPCQTNKSKKMLKSACKINKSMATIFKHFKLNYREHATLYKNRKNMFHSQAPQHIYSVGFRAYAASKAIGLSGFFFNKAMTDTLLPLLSEPSARFVAAITTAACFGSAGSLLHGIASYQIHHHVPMERSALTALLTHAGGWPPLMKRMIAVSLFSQTITYGLAGPFYELAENMTEQLPNTDLSLMSVTLCGLFKKPTDAINPMSAQEKQKNEPADLRSFR